MKNNKGFAPVAIVLIIIAVLALGGVVYYAGKSSTPVPQNAQDINNVNNSTTTSQDSSEAKIIASLKINWLNIQKAVFADNNIPSSTAEQAEKIFTVPSDIQFIGNNNFLTRVHSIESDYNAIFHFNGSEFQFLETAYKAGKGSTMMPVSEWQNLVNKYGNPSYSVSFYTTEANSGRIKFSELTKVSENYFIRN